MRASYELKTIKTLSPWREDQPELPTHVSTPQEPTQANTARKKLLAYGGFGSLVLGATAYLIWLSKQVPENETDNQNIQENESQTQAQAQDEDNSSSDNSANSDSSLASDDSSRSEDSSETIGNVTEISNRYLENLAIWNADARILAAISRQFEQMQIMRQANFKPYYPREWKIDAREDIRDYLFFFSRQGERLLAIQQELTKHGFTVEAPRPDVLEHLKNEKDQEAKDIYNRDVANSVASHKTDIHCIDEMKHYETQIRNKIALDFQAICEDWVKQYVGVRYNKYNKLIEFTESTPLPLPAGLDPKFNPILDSMLSYETDLRNDRERLKSAVDNATPYCGLVLKANPQVNPASFLHLVDEINIHSETADVIDSLNKINDHKRRILKDKGSFGVPGAQAGEIQPYSFSGVIQQQLYFWQVVCHLGGKVAHYFVPEECPNELNADEQVKATTLQNDIKDIRHKLKSLQNKGVINDPNLFAAHLNQLDIRTLKLLKQIARINHDQQALSSELKNIESATKEAALKLNDLLSKEKYIQDFQKSYKGNKNLIIGMEYRMFGEDKIVITEEEDSNPMDDNTPIIAPAMPETCNHTKAPVLYTRPNESQRYIGQSQYASSMALPRR